MRSTANRQHGMLAPMALTLSHTTGQGTPQVRDVTIGDLLREAAAQTPDRIALIEGIADAGARRQWTFAEMLADAERCARALLTRYEKCDSKL